MATATTTTALAPLYKKLLKLAKSLPDAAKRDATMEQIRAEFRSHRDVTDPKEIAALVQRAQSKIGFLKIVTPRTTADAGVKSYVYKNGARVEGEKAMEEGARYKTEDFDLNMRRHTQLVRRQHFMDRKSPPPRPIF
ncbi:hypothetical protein Poli38472_000394 [Pythium oligandrum]|uniref:Complex 1 LYR protein domain-containing protein n=1 Tax=Pythium oligandrum TaxID=41045 RepID=A0A8K1CBV4_PYTOL|nr:hypothetical protein Poli38472_000394 [Pythium oligandrum]|eukprot:TMW60352.1 hypothetical protein Poli38472_000394 [Pythium oligandrum]